MASKTTVAVDENLRKKLKKLSAWLDITQGEILKRAVDDFERKITSDKLKPNKVNISADVDIEKILKQATEKVWATDPESREVQEKLMKGPQTIDDYIITNWDIGLDNED